MAKKDDVENELAKGAPEMKYPNQFDSSFNFGGADKVRKEKVTMRDSKTGKVYGSRIVYQKTTESSLIKELLALEAQEVDVAGLNQKEQLDPDEALPEIVLAEIKSNIRKGAKDLEQNWANALELAHKAYEVASVERPIPSQTEQWRQYEIMIQFAVKQLAATRGIEGSWRMSSADLHM